MRNTSNPGCNQRVYCTLHLQTAMYTSGFCQRFSIEMVSFLYYGDGALYFGFIMAHVSEPSAMARSARFRRTLHDALHAYDPVGKEKAAQEA